MLLSPPPFFRRPFGHIVVQSRHPLHRSLSSSTLCINDIPSYPWADTGIDFIDGIPKGGWKGKPKIATVKLTYGGEIPDPAIYEAGWETMTGCVVREDGSTIEEVTFKE